VIAGRQITEKINDILELVMFKHSVFSLPFIFIAMIIASYEKSGTGWFGWKLLLLGALAALSARNFAMSINRYFDRDIDSINPRTQSRPSVDGRVSSVEMISFISINAILFIVVSYFINMLAFKLSIPILTVLAAYTFFKRFSSMAHFILGFCLGLAPMAGVVAVSNEITFWSIYLAIGVLFWVAGFDLLYSLQDIMFDKEHHLHSIPSKFGTSTTMLIAKICHVFTILFWIFFVEELQLGVWAQAAVLFSAIMLTYEHYLVHKNFDKIDKAFFTINGYLGIVFIFFIIMEVR